VYFPLWPCAWKSYYPLLAYSGFPAKHAGLLGINLAYSVSWMA
jgi:hypothetical protein